MSTPAPDYKKAAPDVVYYSAIVSQEAVAISFCLEKTKIAARTELTFDMKNGGKLLAYLVFGEWIRQMMVNKKWVPASLVPDK